MQREPGLAVVNLAVERNGRRLLEDVSFSVAPGSALLVTGPNGVGKSTLLRAIAGLLTAAAGTVTLQDAQGAEQEAPGACHYLGHSDGLKRSLTVAANVAFAAVWGGSARLPPRVALDRLGIGHVADLPLAFLSAGQRRRAALARLLVSWRPLWLLDEPTTALDTAGEEIVFDVMADHLAAGGMILAATHAPLRLTARSLRLGPA